jgi:beta-glucosidase
VACDHYHRYAEDVALMAEVGLQAYRLSVAWPRIFPDGVGLVNEKGLAFYDRLIDSLLAHQIQPWITLFHWDYPYELYCRGGWLNRDSADWFADYAAVVVDRLSDRVQHWMTLNEPQYFIGSGHQTGTHAPGLQLGFEDILRISHHALLAHGKGVQAIRAYAKTPAVVGAAPAGWIKLPASSRPEDIETARRATFAVTEKTCWNNTWFADPMILGRYPEDGLALFAEDLLTLGSALEEDLKIICQPLDFYGTNIYYGQTVKAQSDGTFAVVPPPDGLALTTMDWFVTPEALYWGPRFFYERYQLPIVVTENGMANCDWVHTDGKVHDPQRIDFLQRYLQAYHRAIVEGIPAQGYFLWSILDNFEWAYGFKQRFGLIYVDYSSQERLLKDSAHWYKALIASHGATLG